jgi:hypothetical protein
MKTKSQAYLALRNKRLSTLLPKTTPSSEQQITSVVGCCKAPKWDVIIPEKKKLVLILVVVPKFFLVLIVSLSNFQQPKIS